jgi:hypothetical protein
MMGWKCTTDEVNEKYIHNIGRETATWNTRQQNYDGGIGPKTIVFEHRR